MQLINVLKRLAELDSANPTRPENKVQSEQNIAVNENVNIEECGTMGGMSQPHSPATINITADSGAELTGMLKDIMSLAGVSQHDQEEPVTGMDGIAAIDYDDDSSMMRKTLDKLNPDTDIETPQDDEVNEYDNDSNPKMMQIPPGTQDAAGHPGVGDRMDGDRPKAFKTETTYESLMAEYRKFLGEDDNYTRAAVNHANRMKQVQPHNKDAWDNEANFLQTAADNDQKRRERAEKNKTQGAAEGKGKLPKEGMADHEDEYSIRSAVLDVLQTIYDGASAGEEMIDTVADELGDYYDEVEQSGDSELMKAYRFVREKGANAEGNPEMMAKVVKQAMSVLGNDQGVAEGINKEASFDYYIDNPEYNPNDPNSPEEIQLQVTYQIHDEERATMTHPGAEAECEIIDVVNPATGEDYSHKVDMARVEEECWEDHDAKKDARNASMYDYERDRDMEESVSQEDTMEAMLRLAGLKK